MAQLTENIKSTFAMIPVPPWLTILAWSVGIVAMTSLTVKDIFPIMRDYFDDNENTQVQIKVRRADEESKAPDLHLCIPLDRGNFSNFASKLVDYLEHGKECPMCEAMTKHKFDVWSHSNGTLSAPSDELRAAFVERVLELENDTSRNGFYQNEMVMRAKNNGINMGNVSWNRPVVSSIVDYLMYQSIMEKSLLDQVRFQGLHMSEPIFVQPPVSTSSLDALYSTLATFVCESIWILDGSRPPDENFCNSIIRDASLVLSETYSPVFCMRLSMDYVEELKIWMLSKYFDKYIGSRKKFMIMNENPINPTKTSTLPTSNLYVSPETDLSLQSTEEVTIAYSIQSSVIEARPQKLKTCYIESSKSECELGCHVDRLESICGCRSYGFGRRSLSRMDPRQFGNRKSYCTVQDYRACTQRVLNSTWHKDICAEKCANACQSTAYQWQISSTITSNSVGESLKLTILNRRQPYLEFVMKVKENSQDLVSKIGGVFGIYLGLNGLSLILFVVSLFRGVRRWLRQISQRRKEEEGITDRKKNPAKVAWRWSINVSTEERLDKVEKNLELVLEKLDALTMRFDSFSGSRTVVE